MARHRSKITQPGYRAGVPNKNKGKTFPAEVLSPEEVFALIEANNCGFSGLRNRAAIVVLWRTGIRVGELCGLRAMDFDFERRTVRVRGTKTKAADRVVAIDRKALYVVRDWLDVRADLGLPRHTAAFCCISRHERGRPLKPTYVRQMLKHLAVKARIDRRVHPHALRHTCASNLVDNGVDIRLVSLQLGHSNSAITARYTDHLNPRRMVDVISELDWPDLGRAA